MLYRTVNETGFVIENTNPTGIANEALSSVNIPEKTNKLPKVVNVSS